MDKWRLISKYMLKSMIKCHNRYLQLTNQVKVGEIRWTATEDKVLRKAVMSYPLKVIKWQEIAD